LAASLQHRISRTKFIESYLQCTILRTKLPFAGLKWRFCIKNHSLQAKNSDFVGKLTRRKPAAKNFVCKITCCKPAA
ncbi:hypothetical protein, partial [Porphyromonas gingivalis]|uniref:hypothetical protein n=1 Tax=Porphyromonas gingivalis TaxID=837 RepID=UPI001F1EC125